MGPRRRLKGIRLLRPMGDALVRGVCLWAMLSRVPEQWRRFVHAGEKEGGKEKTGPPGASGGEAGGSGKAARQEGGRPGQQGGSGRPLLEFEGDKIKPFLDM